MHAFRKLRTFFVSILLLIAIITNSDAANYLNSDAAKYFNNGEMVAIAVNSALKESMKAGYHGSIAKAHYYIGSEENNMNNLLAWFNAVNAYRVIENSLDVTTQSREKEKLKSELNSVKRMIDTIAKNKFNWNRTQTTEQLNVTKYILNNKISDIKNVNF